MRSACIIGRFNAQRSIWEKAHGVKLPKSVWVLHKCDNRYCVNLKHLYLGTAKQNRADFFARNPNAAALFKKFQSAGQRIGGHALWASMNAAERKIFCAKRGQTYAERYANSPSWHRRHKRIASKGGRALWAGMTIKERAAFIKRRTRAIWLARWAS